MVRASAREQVRVDAVAACQCEPWRSGGRHAGAGVNRHALVAPALPRAACRPCLFCPEALALVCTENGV